MGSSRETVKRSGYKWPHLLCLTSTSPLVHSCRRLSRLFKNAPFVPATISSSSPETSKRSQTRWNFWSLGCLLLAEPLSYDSSWREEQQVSEIPAGCELLKWEVVPSLVKRLSDSSRHNKWRPWTVSVAAAEVESHRGEDILCRGWEEGERWRLYKV